MKASELTYGVEIESYVPVANADIITGGYHRGQQMSKAPDGWNAQRDGSLCATPAGHKPAEIVSPILKGEEGLCEVWYMAEYLQEVNAKFNGTTGMHIHVQASHLNDAQLEKLAKLFRKHEQAFMALNGRDVRSRIGNNYCKHSTQWANLIDSYDRYRTLNFCNLHNRKKTVEFRLFIATHDPMIITTAVFMCVGLVAKVSQMDMTEAVSLTKYPRAIELKTAAYQFVREVWNRNANRIIEGERMKELIQTLFNEAEKAEHAAGGLLRNALFHRYGERVLQS